MLFMVVERFAPGRLSDVYGLVRKRGRSIPDGLIYIDSWIAASLNVCYQLMECDNPVLLQEWVARWDDLVEFEIVPVVPSKETADLFNRLAASGAPAKSEPSNAEMS
jgi:hypothetical protein